MIKRLKRACGLLACLGILTLSGCEDSEEDYSSNAPTNSVVSRHVEKKSSNFKVYFGGHMYNGERREQVAEVKSGAIYDVKMLCSNDGDSDTINVYADGNLICTYQTAENRLGGGGWYVDQLAQCQNFTAQADKATFSIETTTDSWGTWPQYLEVTEVQGN